MSQYSIEVPKLDKTSYQCPCSPFVKGMGECACHNMKWEILNDLRGCDTVAIVHGREVVMNWNGKDKFITETEPNPIKRPKMLHEMKLQHPPSHYIRQGGEDPNEKSLKEQYRELKQNK